VGGGIFAVLGLAVGVGKGGTFIAFLVAGLGALLTAYSYAHLSVALPSEGGTVEFLNQAFGPRRLAGSLNVLLWFSYVTTSLYAFAFGSYRAIFLPESAQTAGTHIFISAVIIVMTALNVFSARLITSTEDYIVAAKILILVVFVAVALTDADFAAIKPDTWAGPGSLIAGGMLIFVAYEGFELIAVAEDFALAEAEQVVWGGIRFDLIAVASLVTANLVPLAAISSLASAGFLAIFAVVNIANVRLASVTNANRTISIAGAVACIQRTRSPDRPHRYNSTNRPRPPRCPRPLDLRRSSHRPAHSLDVAAKRTRRRSERLHWSRTARVRCC